MVKPSAFRECVRLVLDSLGLGPPDDGYLVDVEKLQEAATAWHREHRAALGPIQLVLPGEALRRDVVMTGCLSDAIPLGWAGNEAARHFLTYIDQRTEQRCTLLMLQVLVLLQEASRAAVNSRGGSA